ncbi:MAG: hypothetical protein KGL42_08600 [Betaproteobacteria bacterium]|nr:hypothetical protein [Betaproteobacteria bacterium]
MTHPSPAGRPVHIGKLYRPTHFEVRTPTTYSARLPAPGMDAALLQRALLRAPLAVVPEPEDEPSVILDRMVAWAAVLLIVAVLFAVQLHLI